MRACAPVAGHVLQRGDCDDADATANPDGTELACDGIDQDCRPETPDRPDVDGDGASCADDCDDADRGVYVGRPERCDGLDQDCDGVADEGLAETWCHDPDGDGLGDEETSACGRPDLGWTRGPCREPPPAPAPSSGGGAPVEPRGCGCSGAGSPTSAWTLVVALFASARSTRPRPPASAGRGV